MDISTELLPCDDQQEQVLTAPLAELRTELHRLVDRLDEPYVPALVELVRACLPPDTTYGIIWISLWWTCLA